MQIDTWDFVKAIAALAVFMLGAIWTFGAVIVRQFEARLEEKFKAQAEARLIADGTLNEAMQRHLAEEKLMGAQIAQLERDFLTWKGELPLNYVRREDYVRGQTVIEAKLDALYSELKLVQLRGNRNDS